MTPRWTPRRHCNRLRHKAWTHKPIVRVSEPVSEHLGVLPAWERTAPGLWQLCNPNFPGDYTKILGWVEAVGVLIGGFLSHPNDEGAQYTLWIPYLNRPLDGKPIGKQAGTPKNASLLAREAVEKVLLTEGWTR